MSALFALLVGIVAAILLPHGDYFPPDARYTISYAALAATAGWFIAGAFVGSIVRFVGPKTELVITLLGTKPIQVLKTGIRLSLPWPFGFVERVVHTNVWAKQVDVQIKSKDNLVFMLPVTIQHRVTDSMKFAFEREDPIKQMTNLTVASVRATGNNMEFQAIYDDKAHIKDDVVGHIANNLAGFGIEIVDLLIEDPKLPESISNALNGIREAEYGKQAAQHQAETIFTTMVGEARAEAESTRLKGSALASFRLLIAEGNAAAIAVMQGKLALKWEDQQVGEGEHKKTVKVAKFVDPKAGLAEGEMEIPQIDLDPGVILEFFKVVDSNDAIRDAASKPGTVIVAPAGGNSGFDFSKVTALQRALPKAA